MEAYFKGTLLYDKDFQRIKANKGSEIDGKELRSACSSAWSILELGIIKFSSLKI